MPYVPALDGLRALAVVAVLLYHHDASLLPGGFLGVSLFFTLSGFLITSILSAEHRQEGRIGLVSFWGARARRLLPASLLTLFACLLITWTVIPEDQHRSVLTDIAAAAANLANWRFISADIPYADLDLVGSPVRHYWSLAIEEQYYLVFPVLALLALRRRFAFPALLAAIAATSFALQVVIDDAGRVYDGSDTRMGELAVGALLALGLPAIRHALDERGRWLADLLGVAGLVALGVLVARVPLATSGLTDGGLFAVTVVWVALLVAGIEGPRIGRVLAFSPLVAIGRRSYGVYLFHVPLYLVVTEDRTGLDGPLLLGARLAGVGLFAALSYQLIEQPIRYTWRPATRVLQPALGFAVVVGIIGVALGARPASAPEIRIAEQNTIPEVAAATSTTTSSTVVPPTSVATPAETTTTSTSAPPRAPHILLIGDSTSRSVGEGLQAWGERTGSLRTTMINGNGCAVLRGDRVKVREGMIVRDRCGDVIRTALAALPDLSQRPDAIVVMIGCRQMLDWSYDGEEEFHSIVESMVQQRYVAELEAVLADLWETRLPVLWADNPLPEWDIDYFAEENFGAPFPGEGPSTMNDPARRAALEALDVDTFASVSFVERWAYTAVISEPDGSITRETRPDGLHVDPAVSERLAPELDDAMAVAYRRAIAQTSLDPGDHRWTNG